MPLVMATRSFSPAGIYNLATQITIPADRHLVGQKGAILKAGTGKYCFQTDPNNSSAIYIGGFEVKGRLLRIDNHYGGWSSDIEVAGNTFDPINLYAHGTEYETIFVANGAKNLWVHDNVIAGVSGDGFVLGYGYQNVEISGNTFSDGNEGIHYLGNYGQSDKLIVAGNRFTNMHRMDVELQGDGGDVLVQDNIISGADVRPDFSQNVDTFGLSVSTDGATNITVRRNQIISYDREDGTGMRIGIELAGTKLRCYENDIEGTNAAITLNSSVDGEVFDNRIIGSLQGVQDVYGRTPGAVFRDNSSDVTLDWTPMTVAEISDIDPR